MCEMETMGLDGTRRHEKNDTPEALADIAVLSLKRYTFNRTQCRTFNEEVHSKVNIPPYFREEVHGQRTRCRTFKEEVHSHNHRRTPTASVDVVAEGTITSWFYATVPSC